MRSKKLGSYLLLFFIIEIHFFHSSPIRAQGCGLVFSRDRPGTLLPPGLGPGTGAQAGAGAAIYDAHQTTPAPVSCRGRGTTGDVHTSRPRPRQVTGAGDATSIQPRDRLSIS